MRPQQALTAFHALKAFQALTASRLSRLKLNQTQKASSHLQICNISKRLRSHLMPAGWAKRKLSFAALYKQTTPSLYSLSLVYQSLLGEVSAKFL